MTAVEKDAIHRVSGIDDRREPLDPVAGREDRAILRELGKEIAEIGSLPVQEEIKRRWSRLNRLEPVKPMIWLNDICWNELDVDGELRSRTSSPFCRRIESELRQTIYWWKHMRGDLVVDPFVCSPLAIGHSGIGIEVEEDITQTDETNDIVSHHYHEVGFHPRAGGSFGDRVPRGPRSVCIPRPARPEQHQRSYRVRGLRLHR